MAEFAPAVEKLLEVEGGFAARDNKNGAVNRGITSSFLKLIGRPYSTEDVRELTVEDAKVIYREYFWDKFRLGEINSQRMAEMLLSLTVNTDPQVVICFLHFALEDVGHPVVRRDAPPSSRVIGTKTVMELNALSESDTLEVIERVKAAMKARYRRLAEKNPVEFGDDLTGWVRRVDGL